MTIETDPVPYSLEWLYAEDYPDNDDIVYRIVRGRRTKEWRLEKSTAMGLSSEVLATGSSLASIFAVGRLKGL